ncbi:MAG TPA: DinB family protein [Cyclobacteriaceae bacterium]|nr:DinB family protein [Cyclobacteriaceae bacterium]
MTTLEICLLQWNTFNTRMQKLFDTISDENFYRAITPNGNSPSWILGHLTDTDDALLELFAIGSRKFPELKTIYNHEKGKNQEGHLSKSDLQAKWRAINNDIEAAFKSWSEKEWLSRHTAVSEEDFKKEPHRNKLNVMLSRVSHRASHLGQIAMLPK